MSSADYQVHNIYRYTRTSYKQNRDCEFNNSREDEPADQGESSRDEFIDHSPRSDECDDYALVTTGCLYDLEEGDMTSILHKKCAVITLAQQQLERVLDETNQMLARVPEENCRIIRCCRGLRLWHNPTNSVLLTLIFISFFSALLLGAATCGTQFAQFNNPILNCIDNYFVPDSISFEESLRCIT